MIDRHIDMAPGYDSTVNQTYAVLYVLRYNQVDQREAQEESIHHGGDYIQA